MNADKKFCKCQGIVVVIIVLLAGLAVPATVAMTSRTKAEPEIVAVQSDKEDISKSTAKLVQLGLVEPAAITVEKLADICEAMESVIVDISVEYEWYNIPPWTMETLIVKDGILNFKLSAARSLSAREPNDPNFMLFDRLLLEESATVVTKEENSFESVLKYSYNGKVVKHLNVGGWPREIRSGIVSYRKEFVPTLTLSPLGFSILRLSMTDKIPLSAWLRDKEFVRIDNTIEKVGGFNTIRADLLQWSGKNVYLRIYFSVDHGYYPVMYEHMGKSVLNFEVHSLEQVAEGLWFPSSGLIRKTDNERMDGFQTIGKIVVNQGLTDEHFDIDFPPGTEVRDEIRGTEYIVKPTKEQKEKFEKEKQWLKEHADETAAMEKEGGRIYSAARLMKLLTAIDLYMTDNDEKFPQTLDDLKLYFGDKDKETFSWLLKNVEYLGSDLEPEKIDVTRTPIAYDKTLLKKGEGTNVLFVNGLVEFCKPDRLEKVGINDSENTQVE